MRYIESTKTQQTHIEVNSSCSKIATLKSTPEVTITSIKPSTLLSLSIEIFHFQTPNAVHTALLQCNAPVEYGTISWPMGGIPASKPSKWPVLRLRNANEPARAGAVRRKRNRNTMERPPGTHRGQIDPWRLRWSSIPKRLDAYRAAKLAEQVCSPATS